jgi:hypothetical protein
MYTDPSGYSIFGGILNLIFSFTDIITVPIKGTIYWMSGVDRPYMNAYHEGFLYGSHEQFIDSKWNSHRSDQTGAGDFGNSANEQDPHSGEFISTTNPSIDLSNQLLNSISQESYNTCMYACLQNLYYFYGVNTNQTAVKNTYNFYNQTPTNQLNNTPSFVITLRENLFTNNILQTQINGISSQQFESEIYNSLQNNDPILTQVTNNHNEFHGIIICGLTEYGNNDATIEYYDPNCNFANHIGYMDLNTFFGFTQHAAAITGIGPSTLIQ